MIEVATSLIAALAKIFDVISIAIQTVVTAKSPAHSQSVVTIVYGLYAVLTMLSIAIVSILGMSLLYLAR